MSDAQATKSDPYRATLNLPVTNFAMKANLATKEPQIQERWGRLSLYDTLVSRESPRGKFVFHDGPPYANGPIHIGHLLNKILKDVVVRSRVMRGYSCDYVPGWDCHGLPIEHKVLKELGAEARNLSQIEVRKRCHDSAQGYIETQGAQMQRLGTLANYAKPYLTMAPGYEAGVLEVFATLVERGIVYRDLKPVHWSIANRTALADAELEYIDRKDPSIYVMFEVDSPVPASLNATGPVSLMIWTTTPWTLPANLAVAVSPHGKYGLYRIEQGGKKRDVIVVENLHAKVFELGGVTSFEHLGSCTGDALVGATYKHPFITRQGRVLPADYVTFEDGTGLVHTAPGHGIEDYQTGLKNGLEIYCPVQANGTYDDTVPEWLRGVDVWKANPKVVEHLKESGHLFHYFEFTHSYPHDWRSKTPTIFRATEQWFIGVDKDFEVDGTHGTLRSRAIAATEETIKFVPDWGKNRMRGMLDARPDWCISRQRAWGLPIPAFVTADGRTLLTPETVRIVAAKVRDRGSDVWFASSAQELLEGYVPANDPHAPTWAAAELGTLAKGGDIFDVWFESGSSWHAVLRQRDIGYPAALYLEGSDQHRGWFQTSMLPAIGVTGRPPYETLLTHGFMVDGQGHKMSKSAGNALEVDKLLAQFGADICRWWVSSLNYAHDIKVDLEFFKSASEEYRKVRNTLRFLLANLDGFDVSRDRVELGQKDKHSIDAWAMQELAELIHTVHDGYDTYQFKKVREAIFNFCNDTLSAVYLAAIKDRLYCEAKGSEKRRRTQTVLFDIADALVRMLAPVLVHTADEAYLELIRAPEGTTACVHTLALPEHLDWPRDAVWAEVMALRSVALKGLEDAKGQSGIANPLDAGITVTVSAEAYARLAPYAGELADLCGVSRFALASGTATEPVVAVADLREEPRCQRSWKRDGTVKQRSDGGWLSQRDAEALGLT